MKDYLKVRHELREMEDSFPFPLISNICQNRTTEEKSTRSILDLGALSIESLAHF